MCAQPRRILAGEIYVWTRREEGNTAARSPPPDLRPQSSSRPAAAGWSAPAPLPGAHHRHRPHAQPAVWPATYASLRLWKPECQVTAQPAWDPGLRARTWQQGSHGDLQHNAPVLMSTKGTSDILPKSRCKHWTCLSKQMTYAYAFSAPT